MSGFQSIEDAVPDYEKDVLLLWQHKYQCSDREITIGQRTHTDSKGHHYNGSPGCEYKVIGWQLMPPAVIERKKEAL